MPTTGLFVLFALLLPLWLTLLCILQALKPTISFSQFPLSPSKNLLSLMVSVTKLMQMSPNSAFQLWSHLSDWTFLSEYLAITSKSLFQKKFSSNQILYLFFHSINNCHSLSLPFQNLTVIFKMLPFPLYTHYFNKSFPFQLPSLLSTLIISSPLHISTQYPAPIYSRANTSSWCRRRLSSHIWL